MTTDLHPLRLSFLVWPLLSAQTAYGGTGMVRVHAGAVAMDLWLRWNFFGDYHRRHRNRGRRALLKAFTGQLSVDIFSI